MQLTEQRPGLWGCIGFSRNRGQVTVQVFPSWGTGQASHNHLLHNRWSAVSRKPPFFLWNWDTFSRNSTAAFFTEHTVWAPKTRPTTASIILKRNHGCRSKWETSTLLRIALALGPPQDGQMWAGQDMRAAGAGLVWLQKGGKFSCEGLTTRTTWGTCPRARGLANLEKAQVFLSYQMTQRGKKKCFSERWWHRSYFSVPLALSLPVLHTREEKLRPPVPGEGDQAEKTSHRH